VAAVLAGMPDLEAGGEDVESAQPPVIRPDNSFFQRLKEGHELLERKDFDAAEARFKEALEIYPRFADEGDPYRGLAELYREQGKTDLLMGVLESFLQISEHGAAEARELGALYFDAGQPERAVYYLERSLEVEPYDAEARKQLATLYEQQGRFDEAVRQRRALLALNPVDRANAYYTLAMSLHQQGEYQEARRAVLQALELAPTFREAQRLLLQVVESAE
jgi:tetratricopeptide (TPR) repeat protein